MEHEDCLKGFESLLIELEYAIADYQCEKADNQMGPGYFAPRLTSSYPRCAVLSK